MDGNQTRKLIENLVKQAKGDVIIGSVGSNATGVAMGKNVHQDIDLEAKESSENNPQSEKKQLSSHPKIDEKMLRQLLIDYFNVSELSSLCFDMDIDYEMLGGNNKNDKARELLTWCIRHGQLEKLITHCYELRPHAFV